MGRYIRKNDEAAEQMFERLIGYSYAENLQTEIHTFGKRTGSQIKLNHEPNSIESCQGHLEYEQLRFNGWVEIPLGQLTTSGRVIDIPPSIFGVRFSAVEVAYLTGETIIPQDIQDAVEEISELMSMPNATVWNLPLSPTTLETINKYRNLHERG